MFVSQLKAIHVINILGGKSIDTGRTYSYSSSTEKELGQGGTSTATVWHDQVL